MAVVLSWSHQQNLSLRFSELAISLVERFVLLYLEQSSDMANRTLLTPIPDPILLLNEERPQVPHQDITQRASKILNLALLST